MITEPGKEITWGEMHVGARQVFAEAGFAQLTHPTGRRVVTRMDFRTKPGSDTPGPIAGGLLVPGTTPPAATTIDEEGP